MLLQKLADSQMNNLWSHLWKLSLRLALWTLAGYSVVLNVYEYGKAALLTENVWFSLYFSTAT
jgi:hypothetical protein